MTFRTDKVRWGYLPTYQAIAAEVGTAGRVCEIGVWQGGSLEMWQTLFPQGTVVGVDIDASLPWPPGTVKVVGSQNAPETRDQVAAHGPFDLIVDDASHVGRLTRETFQLLWPLVKPGGYYVVEDWMISFWPEWASDVPSMRDVVSGFLDLLEHQDRGASSVTYRYGLAVVHKHPAA